ncbi:hypothetical protein EUTSA_v10005552mg [Eutrema salsugineum]|uniref:NAC domain-containing protein n=1 Tax=Eutrema salsugineum TaxID=72664 RepID=V4K1B6_EUTSA|nr:hypothetical protein EUTSA_v10005552mg [Eutrema salsugineum]
MQADVIKDVGIYKMEPWDIQGTRTNRATGSGFWKATGRDKAIYSKQELVGMRKTLVFYKGRAPNGQKSDWIMHEYRLETDENGPPHEEGWVVLSSFQEETNNDELQQSQNTDGIISPRMFQGSSSSSLSSLHHNDNDPYGVVLSTINATPTTSMKRDDEGDHHGHVITNHEDDHMIMMNTSSVDYQDHQTGLLLNDGHNDQVMDWQTLEKFVASQLIMSQEFNKDPSDNSSN